MDVCHRAGLRHNPMREHFAEQRRRIPLLHRNSGFHLISLGNEHTQRVDSSILLRFNPYR
jgi:hypothetical protein